MDGEIPETGMADVIINKQTFTYFLVEEDGILTMPSGCPHAAFNITDCVAQGGHNYLKSSLEAAFKIGLREHKLGNQDTNTSHVASENILHSVLTHYYLAILALHPGIVDGTNTDNVTYADLQKAIRFFPSPVQMACLLCMTAHTLAFERATILEDKEGYECPASIYMMRKTSRDRARRLLDWFAALREPMRSRELLIMASLKDTELQEHFVPFFAEGV
ncbi:hypothetical protein M422DRAFT_267488 [Sphaerobolus stellatus SS14]|uniref:JmjC domain-containing protein n=1 Tax=Sphaerobolus stellatus (strain SS14) TaxID=990650 RepID=A0A0C9TM29_SPHS4|nr:hypothetical protein M422DRAFT_267488 [Sphaerobolus stellatus SS14]